MDAPSASTESCVDRHRHFCGQLRAGLIADPERWLFLKLIDDPPPALAATPYLHAVSWHAGRFDLLFTDGRDTWCAVEVKDAPEIYDTGKARENRRDKDRKRRKHLLAQAEDAWRAACAQHPNGVAVALALWRRTERWEVLAELGPAQARVGGV